VDNEAKLSDLMSVRKGRAEKGKAPETMIITQFVINRRYMPPFSFCEKYTHIMIMLQNGQFINQRTYFIQTPYYSHALH